MDLQRMIAELREEKTRLDEAIEALERLSSGGHRRRGRPPKWLAHEGGSDGHALLPALERVKAAASAAKKPGT